jgi:hypothetical protein
MKYKGVDRVITIFITKHGSHYDIEVNPEFSEAWYGDTVHWKVQGAPRGVKVTVGNLTRFDPPPSVLLRNGIASIAKPRGIRPGGAKGNSQALKYKTRKSDWGAYKYDVLFDGVPVLDPELEIKGPGGK